MLKILTVLFSLLSVSTAIAADGSTLPPKRYDHAFHGTMYQYYDEWIPGVWGHTTGARNGVCVIHTRPPGTQLWGARPLDKQSMDTLVRHERGHCNGWPSNHPR